MIKHIVMWKLKESAEGNNKESNAKKMKHLLESLKQKIPQIVSIEVGLNKDGSKSSYDIVLYSEFRNMQDLEKYQSDAEHKKVSDFISKIRSDRKVIDYEV